MFLQSLKIRGYRGVSPDDVMELSDLGHRNVLIGSNNAGKSTVLRFLHDIARVVALNRSNPQNVTGPIDARSIIDSLWFWRQDESVGVEAEMEFRHEPNTTSEPATDLNGVSVPFLVDRRSRFHIHIDSTLVLVSPLAFVENGWEPYVRWNRHERELETRNSDGKYEKPDVRRAKVAVAAQGSWKAPKPVLEPGYENDAVRMKGAFVAWVESVGFVDAIRSLDRPPGRVQSPGQPPATQRSDDPQDGSNLLKELRDWQQDGQQDVTYTPFSDRLREDLNFVFGSRFLAPHFKDAPTAAQVPDIHLRLEGDGTIPYSIRTMGTGVSQAVILLATLRRDEARHRQRRLYCLEEPECHFHPTLLRRLFRRLRVFTEPTFLISTHSSALINDLTEVDRLYHFRQKPAGNCIAERCVELPQYHRVLDQLGVHGSDLVQTNCVIWVEGPSDRLYVREWINAYHAKVAAGTQPPIEGIDYSIVLYGGSLLAHLSLDERLGEDFVQLLRVSRFSAVVMDRDRDPLKRAPRRVKDEADQDPNRRLAVVTDGREIENDIPRSVLLKAAASRLGIEPEQFRTAELNGAAPFPEELASCANLTGEEHERAVKRLSDKVLLAKKVLELATIGDWQNNMPTYIERLCDLIRRSQPSL